MDTQSLPVKATPYQHQREACGFACRLFGLDDEKALSRGIALLMEMGTGKTLTAIAVAGRLYLTGNARRALIVAPLSIVGVWQDEFARYAAFDHTIYVITGTAAKKQRALWEAMEGNGCGLRVLVVNYESAWRMEKELQAWDADLIIADEGHRMKTHNTAVSKAMHRLGARARYRLLLTGTIITNKALDIFSQYKYLNPAIFGTSFYAFRSRYFDLCGYGNHTPVMKKSMESDLTQRMHSIAYRATKAQCLDLPEITEIVRRVALEPKAAAIYSELVRESYAALDKGEVTAPNVLTKILRLSQLTGGFLRDEAGTDRVVSAAKLGVLSDIVDSAAEEGQKLIIIARFLPELNAIGKLLGGKGIKYARISGEVKDRDEQVRMFQNDPECTVFVGQIATAGLGITLTAASSLVFYSLDYSMSNFEQTKARIHRVGQKNACTYIYLTATGTMDEKVLRALRDKADLARLLVDDYRKGRNPYALKDPHQQMNLMNGGYKR